MVSGHTPIVLKLNKQDCVAQSMSRREEALATCRQTAAFPLVDKWLNIILISCKRMVIYNENTQLYSDKLTE